MASAVPVLATRAGQICEVIEHQRSGFLVSRNNVSEAVEHILYLKNNPARAREIGLAGRAEIERYYNWQRAAAETEKIFLSLVNGKKGHTQ